MSFFKNILCPIDFSNHSLKALDKAVEMAKKFISQITVAHIIESDDSETFDSAVPLHQPRENMEALELFLKERMPEGIEFYPYVTYGDPAIEILRLEKVYEIDTIIMGLYGKENDIHRLSGSVSQRVYNEAESSVFTVMEEVEAEEPISIYEADPSILSNNPKDNRKHTNMMDNLNSEFYAQFER